MEKRDGRSISRETLEAYRYRAIDLRYKLGYSVTRIAEIFNLNYYSVARWFCKHRKKGKRALKRKYAPGASCVLDKELLKWLEQALTQPATDFGFSTPLWTGPMVRILLRKEWKIKLDRVTVWRYLQRMDFSFKKPVTRYFEQNKKFVREWIRHQWPRIKAWVRRNRAILYFEDESGVSLAPVIGKTWSKKGKTPIIRVTGKRGGVLAMSAISPSGRMLFRLEKRRINSKVMIEFFKQIMQSHKRRKIALVMDQAPCHVSKMVRDYEKSEKKLKIFYVPPYSPDLNPDEKVWRHLKNISLKDHHAQNKNQLTRVVLSALRKIQKSPGLTNSFFKNYLT